MSEKDDERCCDNVTDQEREWAQNALAEFKKKNYSSCLQHFGKLDNRVNDFKVVHNKAVVEYYKSDLKKTDTFQKNLTSISNQFRIKIEKVDDVDHCTIHYNQAVLLYHQRQYTAAMRIMDRVYKFIEPMEDTFAKQVSLLAIELQLCVKQPDKALTLINYFETHLLSGNGGQINIKDKGVKEKEKKIIPLNDPNTEEFKLKLVKYKVRCYLMKHSLQTANNELQILYKDKTNIDAIFLAANIEYMKGNFHESTKLLTSIPNDSLIFSECGESSTVMFYNNMGIIHHAMGKPNMACHYYQMALKEEIAAVGNGKNDVNEKPLYTLGGSKYHEIIYNLGISLLYAGKPTQAFDCLIIAVRRYHRNSRLWLRIAECCIMAHKESNEEDFDLQKKQKELIVQTIGTKEKQKIVLTSNLSRDRKYSTESQSYAVPVPSLEFASLCLRNAYLLIPSDAATPPVPVFLIPGVSPPVPPPSPGPAPSNPLSTDTIQALRNHILITSAYVALCLGDYIIALEHSRDLLKQPRISENHKLLAHLYAAESLILLDQIPEALKHLNPESIKDISFSFTAEENDNTKEKLKTNPPNKWFPTTFESAQAVLQYNIAVAKTIRGQLDQASVILKEIWQQKGPNCQIPAHIIMLVIYIELQLGHADSARNLIKKYSFQHRFNG